MKSSKDALRTARQLLRLSLVDGSVDADRVKGILRKFTEEKPRGYLATLSAFQRLLRLELEKKHAVVESAEKLGDDLAKELDESLKKKYGDDLTIEFMTIKALIGGMRVRVGSDVWDGSVKSRLEQLATKI